MQQLRGVCFLLGALALAGCTNYYAEGELVHYRGPPSTRGPAGDYLLGPGDRVRIKSYDDANVTGEYEVNSAGFVSVPLVGQIKASGLTTRKLEDSIVSGLKGQLSAEVKVPRINVEIATYAPFYVFGEVKKPGNYPFQPGITLADAIATAGGLTYRADEGTILLQRAGSTKQIAVPMYAGVRLYPGDNIQVAERWF